MLKVLVGYPSSTEEFVIVERMTGALQNAQQVLDPEGLLDLQRQTDRIYVDPAVTEYAVSLVTATRYPQEIGQPELDPLIEFGASPRASIHLILGARALALMRGRSYALPQDVRDLVPDVIRHRLVLSYEALADNVSQEELIAGIVEALPMPEIPTHERAAP